MAEAYLEQAMKSLLNSIAPYYNDLAPESQSAPFIVGTIITDNRWRAINGPSGMTQTTVQVDLYADGIEDRASYGRQIRQALDGYRGTVAIGSDTLRIGGISLQNQLSFLEDGTDPKLYRLSGDYLVTFEES